MWGAFLVSRGKGALPILLAGMFLLVTGTAHAESDVAQSCSDDVLSAVSGAEAQANPAPGATVVTSACKAMPDAPATTIAVVGFVRHHPEAKTDDADDQDVVVALVRKGDIVAAHREPFIEDPVTRLGTFSIDTAPYLLAPGVRAFGTVLDSGIFHHCVDALADRQLTLWVREGDTLRPVLGTNLTGSVLVGGEGMSCNGLDYFTDDAEITLGVEREAHHGFFDVSLTAHVKRDDGKQHLVRQVLQYDGKSYGIDMFRTFWYRDSMRPK